MNLLGNTNTRSRYKIIFVIWALTLTVSLLSPGDDSYSITLLDWPYSDKLVHLLSFVILIITMRLAFDRTRFAPLLVVAAAYGIIIELFQIIVPGRTFEFLDWAADVGGTIIGYLAFISLKGRKV